jgi:hypothetical protein
MNFVVNHVHDTYQKHGATYFFIQIVNCEIRNLEYSCSNVIGALLFSAFNFKMKTSAKIMREVMNDMIIAHC